MPGENNKTMNNLINNIINFFHDKNYIDTNNIIKDYLKENNINLYRKNLIFQDKNFVKTINHINKTFSTNIIKRFNINHITNKDKTIKAYVNRKGNITYVKDTQANFTREVTRKYDKSNNLIFYRDNYLKYQYEFRYLDKQLHVAIFKNDSSVLSKTISSSNQDTEQNIKLLLIRDILKNNIILNDAILDTHFLRDYILDNNLINEEYKTLFRYKSRFNFDY